MKQILLFLQISSLTLIFSTPTLEVSAQKYYKVKTHLMNGKIVKGYLYQVNNYSIYILPTTTSTQIDSIKAEEIRQISIRRKGKVGRSIAWGAGTGGVSMGIAGLVTYEPCPSGCFFGPNSAEDQAAFTGITGAIVGAFVGGIAGIFNNSTKRIDGNRGIYLLYVPKLKKYALQKTA